nr:outer membrane beta-barrel protein [uncultured Allomuricauda sp.]
MGKKNLEQLFKERFQDFQDVPDQKVWNSIEASLDKKKQKKRAIPIWWGLGGIAAAIAIMLLVLKPFAEEPINKYEISDKENTLVPSSSKITEENSSEDVNKPPMVSEKGESLVNDSEIKKTENQKGNQSIDNRMVESSVAAVAENTASKSNGNNVFDKAQANTKVSESQIIQSKKDDGSVTNEAIAIKNSESKPVLRQPIGEISENTNQIAQNTEKKEEAEKQSIYDAIEEQKDIEEEVIATNKPGKWSVGPSLAPVYFDASGDGSPVGPDFSTNSKSGQLNLSYGLTVAYELGKKLKIRSGVHRVDYGYSTNDVVFSSTLRAASTDKIANIDYNQNSTSIIVQSKENAKSSPAISSKEIALSEAPSLDGKMVQQLGYIEVPLEINYAVLDKKFGVDLIGGVSSLFLVDNSVLLESNNLVTEMGEANNINSLNFSANVGMGLNYQFSPKIRINVEPVFKYQLNTFSNVSGNFQPYSIGVYSGFSFRF